MSTTTTSLAGLIPHELMSGVLQQSMGDQANLLDICNVREGFVAYKFAELNNLTAAGVGEGAALVPATVTPESVRIVATPQEVPAIQITNLAMETQEVDWINLSGALGNAPALLSLLGPYPPAPFLAVLVALRQIVLFPERIACGL